MTNRQRPYSLIGTDNSAQVSTATEMLELAGLDWEVSLNSIYAAGKYDPIEVEGKFATVKTDKDGNESILSVVGSRYKVFQNTEVFSVLNDIVSDGSVKYAAAGELSGGKVVWTTLELPNSISIGDDEHQAYIVARSSHDGTTPFQMTAMVNRLSCTNQINATMVSGKANGCYYSLRHTTNNNVDATEIMIQLNLIKNDIQNYSNVSNWLRAKPMERNEFINFTREVYWVPSKIENAPLDMLNASEKRILSRALNSRSKAIRVWDNETGTQENIQNTYFAAFQSVVEAADHFAKDTTRQAEKILLGTDSGIKMRALELLRR